MLEKDGVMDIGNMHKKLVKIAPVVPEISCRRDRQTDRHTDAIITIASPSIFDNYSSQLLSRAK